MYLLVVVYFLLMLLIEQEVRKLFLLDAGPKQCPSELGQRQLGEEAQRCRSAAVLLAFRESENRLLCACLNSIKMCNISCAPLASAFLSCFMNATANAPRFHWERHHSIFLSSFPIKLFSQIQQAVKMAKSNWHMNLERMRMMKRRRKRISSLLMGVKMKWRQKFWTMCELNEQSGYRWTESSLLLFFECWGFSHHAQDVGKQNLHMKMLMISLHGLRCCWWVSFPMLGRQCLNFQNC